MIRRQPSGASGPAIAQMGCGPMVIFLCLLFLITVLIGLGITVAWNLVAVGLGLKTIEWTVGVGIAFLLTAVRWVLH